MLPSLTFSEETVADERAIQEVVGAAFGQPGEAELVRALRKNGGLLFSAVARLDTEVVAHIGFSPVSIGGSTTSPPVLALTPVAVLPSQHRKGYGSGLVRWSIQLLAGRGFPALIVLGEPGFYSRFGFQPASHWGITCPFEVPGEYYMAMELVPGGLTEQVGGVGYRPEFAAVT